MNLLIYVISLFHVAHSFTNYYPCNVTTTSSLSQARVGLAGTSVGSLALFAGGNTYSEYSNVVDIFNASSNTWTVAFLSEARGYLAATSVGNLALFAGGSTDSENSNVVDIFNTSSNTWSTTSLKQGKYNLVATSVGNLALFAGGVNDTGFSNVVDIFDASSNNWTVAFLSQARDSLAATNVGNLALFAGGITDSGYSNVVDIFNASSNTWTVTFLSQARHNIAATSVGDLALFAGGDDYYGIDIFNVTSNSWKTTHIEVLPSLLAASVGNLVIFSGQSFSIFNVSSNTWSLTVDEQTGVEASATVGDRALFAGGENGGLHTLVTIYIASPNCDCPHVNLELFGCGGNIIGTSSTTDKSDTPTVLNETTTELIIVFTVILGILAVVLVFYVIYQIKLQYLKTRWQIKNIVVLDELHENQMEDVFNGILDETTHVMLKKLNSIDFSKQEVALRSSLNHPNVVHFYGIHTSSRGEQFLVFEFLSGGSLDMLLKDNKMNLTTKTLVNMLQHILSGVNFLAEHNIVHQDFALQNLLATQDMEGNYIVKLGNVQMEEPDTIQMPLIKWSAPELFTHQVPSSKSAVWSFGVCVWQLFSYSDVPYPDMSDQQVMETVAAGYRMPPPTNCPADVCMIMESCWKKDPDQRPTFRELSQKISRCYRQFAQPTHIPLNASTSRNKSAYQ